MISIALLFLVASAHGELSNVEIRYTMFIFSSRQQDTATKAAATHLEVLEVRVARTCLPVVQDLHLRTRAPALAAHLPPAAPVLLPPGRK